MCLPSEIEKHEDDDGVKKEEEVKKYLDIISNKNIKLCERVLIPVQQYPKVGHVCVCVCVCVFNTVLVFKDLKLILPSKSFVLGL